MLCFNETSFAQKKSRTPNRAKVSAKKSPKPKYPTFSLKAVKTTTQKKDETSIPYGEVSSGIGSGGGTVSGRGTGIGSGGGITSLPAKSVKKPAPKELIRRCE